MASFHQFILDAPTKIIKALPPVPNLANTYSHVRVPPSMLEDSFLDWLETKSLRPRVWANLILFYAHPNTRTAVHIDNGPGGANMWALNFLLTPGELSVFWCEAKEGEKRDVDLAYTRFSADSPVLERTILSTQHPAAICRIGVPHASSNEGQGCWLMSLRMYPDAYDWGSLCKLFE